MEAQKKVFFECEHGGLLKDCRTCFYNRMGQMIRIIQSPVEKNKYELFIINTGKTPIRRRCPGGPCFCSGYCRDVIGYFE